MKVLPPAEAPLDPLPEEVGEAVPGGGSHRAIERVLEDRPVAPISPTVADFRKLDAGDWRPLHLRIIDPGRDGLRLRYPKAVLEAISHWRKFEIDLNAVELHVRSLLEHKGRLAEAEIDVLREEVKAEIARFRAAQAEHAHILSFQRGFRAPAAPPGVLLAPVTPALSATPDVFVNGVALRSYGAVEAAVTAAKNALLRQTARPDIAARLAARRVTIVIIPQNVRMTDLPEFASLRGQRTVDGRPWEDVRGVGGTPTRDGRIVVGISEEDLAKLPNDPYPVGFSVAEHEIAHVIQNYGLPPDELRSAIGHFNDFMRNIATNADDARWFGNVRWYGNENYEEHWAMLYNTLTATGDGEGPSVRSIAEGAALVARRDAGTYRDLVKAYPALGLR
jgi:hypothetical protein